MCQGQQEDHLLKLLKSLDLKNVAQNIGIFGPPHAEDVVNVNPGASTEKF
jgi:hypothetical protein